MGVFSQVLDGTLDWPNVKSWYTESSHEGFEHHDCTIYRMKKDSNFAYKCCLVIAPKIAEQIAKEDRCRQNPKLLASPRKHEFINRILAQLKRNQPA